MKPFISTAVFGFFNYALALTMIGYEVFFGVHNLHGAPLLLPLYFGWLMFIMAVFSKHELGFIKVFPVSMHCFVYTFVGFFLMTSPFLYGYYIHVWVPQVLMGGAMLLLGIFTKNSPLTDEPQHVFKDGLIDNISDIDEAMGH